MSVISFRRLALGLVAVSLAALMLSPDLRAQGNSLIQQILEQIGLVRTDLTRIEGKLAPIQAAATSGAASGARIEGELADSGYGLEAIKDAVDSIDCGNGSTGPVRRGTGLFTPPAGASSMYFSWLNPTPQPQTVQMFIYRTDGLGRVKFDFGRITIPAQSASWNSYSVTSGGAFELGVLSDVIVEVSHPDVLTSFDARDSSFQPIPGSQVFAADWVRLH
jgi:hypothetical protein